jgi:exodeoxyribonuclease VII large subunit
VICGIGHDQDVALVALAADLGVSTPTAVTRELNRSWEQALSAINLQEHKIFSAYAQSLLAIGSAMDRSAAVIERRFRGLLEAVKRYEQIIAGKVELMGRYLAETKMLLIQYERAVAFNNPMRQLKLGYSLTMKGGKLLKSAKEIKVGEQFAVRLSDGIITSEAINIE